MKQFSIDNYDSVWTSKDMTHIQNGPKTIRACYNGLITTTCACLKQVGKFTFQDDDRFTELVKSCENHVVCSAILLRVICLPTDFQVDNFNSYHVLYNKDRSVKLKKSITPKLPTVFCSALLLGSIYLPSLISLRLLCTALEIYLPTKFLVNTSCRLGVMF